MNRTGFFAGLLAALLGAPATQAQEGAVATVNGVRIPEAYVEFMLSRDEVKAAKQSPEQLRTAARENLINQEVVVQEAKKSGLLSKAEVRTEIALREQRAVFGIYVREWLKSNPVTDDDVRAAYDAQRARMGNQEYHARHILVDSEDAARRIIEELNGGTSFESLAQQSKDAGSRARGGDLGWALPTIYVKPFADALTRLEKGQITATPVRTQFGYHVIRLDDVRETRVRPFEEVERRMRQQLMQQKIAGHIRTLRDKAKVQ